MECVDEGQAGRSSRLLRRHGVGGGERGQTTRRQAATSHTTLLRYQTTRRQAASSHTSLSLPAQV
jgi:hypothetical protein